ncbi:lysosome membrane protein 2-like isoform X2 [Scyliorhinus canicula]|uniref:lysosome membrane protein 2-like isoform X2 n=1 Tax=Scyliorhinus canicula TaxID=7830 RepID=UPI0018F52B02|nr:lysosome membrane protein 2-like isoform X2 [Scyliorhinus canicula]
MVRYLESLSCFCDWLQGDLPQSACHGPLVRLGTLRQETHSDIPVANFITPAPQSNIVRRDISLGSFSIVFLLFSRVATVMVRLRNKAALIGGFALCCFIIFLILIVKDVFKNLVEDQIKKHTKLKLNGEAFKNWKEPPVPAYLQFYFFHVENQLQILQGERAIVKQLGPYTYKKLRYRGKVSFYNNATVSATTHRSFIFEPTMSAGDPRNDLVTTINIPFVTLLQMLKHSGMAKKVIASTLFSLKRNTLFQTRSVNDWLWGYEDPVLKVGHQLLPSIFPSSQFGFFYQMNGTENGEYLFNTGQNDYMKFTEIITWNGQKSLNWWASNFCNMINGTDGASFHPLIKKNEKLYVFAPDICRSFYLTFEKELEVQGINAYRFVLPKETFANDHPSNAGCCPDGICPLSGVLNISVCRQGAPVLISSPHFYNGDPKLVSDIGGMNPNMEAHQTFLDIEPMTGIPVRAAKRMQINLHVESVKYILQTGQIRTMILPVLFLNENAIINDKLAAKLKAALSKMNMATYIPYIFLSVGILLCLTSLIMAFVAWRRTENQFIDRLPIKSKQHIP